METHIVLCESPVPPVGLDGLRSHATYFMEVFGNEPITLELFRRGAGVGYDGVYTMEKNSQWKHRSPLTLAVESPAWEGSNRRRLSEHYFAFCAGTLIGSFAHREGFTLEEIFDV